MSGLKNFDDFLIPISSLSTFTFCPRRYYLLHVECNDSDYGNSLTELGKISHTTVHNSKIEKRKNFIKVHDLQVYSEKLSLIGKCDTVEFYQNSTASYIPFLNGNYDLTIVEHKRNPLDFNDCDIIQITAQVLCLEEMFETKIPIAYIYYTEINKKVLFEITQTYKDKVKSLISKIIDVEKLKEAPKPNFLKSCKNCAAFSICNPKKYNNKKYMEWIIKQL